MYRIKTNAHIHTKKRKKLTKKKKKGKTKPKTKPKTPSQTILKGKLNTFSMCFNIHGINLTLKFMIML